MRISRKRFFEEGGECSRTELIDVQLKPFFIDTWVIIQTDGWDFKKKIYKFSQIFEENLIYDCGIVFGKMARGSGATPEGKRVCNVTLYFPLRVDSAALPPECALAFRLFWLRDCCGSHMWLPGLGLRSLEASALNLTFLLPYAKKPGSAPLRGTGYLVLVHDL